jgi:hypothetical protein
MTQHVPVRLHVSDKSGHSIRSEKVQIARAWSFKDGSGAENARRLVACWNACTGLPTEKLEIAPVFDVAMEAMRHTELVEAQRDELLVALKVVLRDYTAVHDVGDVEMQPSIYQARAAIAKVEGGK